MSNEPVKRRAPQEKGRNPYDGLRPWSAYTHGFGAVLALLGGILLVVRAVQLGGWVRIFSCAVYSLSMLVLYTASTLYHCLNGKVETRVRLRKFDHISIYYLIAGSYTPICALALTGRWSVWGIAMLSAIWILTAVGTVSEVFWANRPRWLTTATFIFMGWIAIFALYPLFQTLAGGGFALLLGGGLLYTVGAVLYALKWPLREHPKFGAHEIFHLFILAGSIVHYLLMYHLVVYL